MQWHDATVGSKDTTGFSAFAARQKLDAGQAQVGLVGQASQAADRFAAAGAASVLPIGLALPCTEEPELFFAESPQDVEQAKALCRECGARITCLTGALERREPWGVWGGEVLMHGAVVPRKRRRGRPRKAEVAA